MWDSTHRISTAHVSSNRNINNSNGKQSCNRNTVGPEMMPIVGLTLLALMDLKYEVNTNTKQRRIKVKQINKLAIKEIKSQKSLDKRKHERFILVRSS